MSAFSAAVDVIFNDPNMAADAVLWPDTPVRVIRREPDDVMNFGGGQFIAPGIVFDVRISEAPDLKKDDMLTVGSDVFLLVADPRADADRLVWSVEVRRE